MVHFKDQVRSLMIGPILNNGHQPNETIGSERIQMHLLLLVKSFPATKVQSHLCKIRGKPRVLKKSLRDDEAYFYEGVYTDGFGIDIERVDFTI